MGLGSMGWLWQPPFSPHGFPIGPFLGCPVSPPDPPRPVSAPHIPPHCLPPRHPPTPPPFPGTDGAVRISPSSPRSTGGSRWSPDRGLWSSTPRWPRGSRGASAASPPTRWAPLCLPRPTSSPRVSDPCNPPRPPRGPPQSIGFPSSPVGQPKCFGVFEDPQIHWVPLIPRWPTQMLWGL